MTSSNDENVWRRRAACADGSVADFFPHPSELDKIAAALDVCSGCPVKAECLADALSWPVTMDMGIRGGKTEEERAEMRRDVAEGEPDHPGHNTVAGYFFEKRHRDATCQACKEAMARYNRVRRYGH
jgi:hypothetical protein